MESCACSVTQNRGVLMRAQARSKYLSRSRKDDLRKSSNSAGFKPDHILGTVKLFNTISRKPL